MRGERTADRLTGTSHPAPPAWRMPKGRGRRKAPEQLAQGAAILGIHPELSGVAFAFRAQRQRTKRRARLRGAWHEPDAGRGHRELTSGEVVSSGASAVRLPERSGLLAARSARRRRGGSVSSRCLSDRDRLQRWINIHDRHRQGSTRRSPQVLAPEQRRVAGLDRRVAPEDSVNDRR